MRKRTLAELNLMDDFLFGKVMSHKDYGKEFGKILLRTILGKEVPYLKVNVQNTFFGADTNYHGIRMDVYLDEVKEGEEAGSGQEIFDIEPDNNGRRKDIEALPRRMRFYHALIDQKALESGAAYEKLRNVWVIMILSYDPIGEDHMVYTIENHIVELPDIKYDDGAKTVLLYIHGKKGTVTEELRQLLSYMEDTIREKAVNTSLLRVQEMVDNVKQNKEANEEFMKSWELARRIEEDARERGFEEGRQEGIQQGIQQEKENTLEQMQRAENAEAKLAEALKKIEELQGRLGM